MIAGSLGRWTRRIAMSLLLVLILIAIAGYFYEQEGRWLDRNHLYRIGKAVDIGGRMLNIDCQGAGAPAVILEAGGNNGGYGGRAVQDGLKTTTTVCWYDRAGEGWSDPIPFARTSSIVVDDLHELLRRADVPPGPYVLVGSSIGGEYVRIFTAKYPAQVAGVVLVDSTSPDQREPAALRSPASRASPAVRRIACALLPVAKEFGVIRFLTRNAPVDVPPEWHEDASAAAKSLRAQRTMAAETEATQGCAATNGGAVNPELGSGDPEVDTAARNAGPLGDRPLVVLTAGKFWQPDDPAVAKELAAYHDVWVHQLQADLARLSSHGTQIVDDKSAHDFSEDPDAVVQAVKGVVLELRKRQEIQLAAHHATHGPPGK